MKSVTLLLKSLLPLLLVLVTAQASWAQFPYPVCSGNGAGKVYMADQTSGEIKIYDPTKPFSATNPVGTGISLPGSPGGATALAIGTNYGTGPNPTYFSTAPGAGGFKNLFYWNGSNWITTGVVMNMDNITGSCGAILGIDCSSGSVQRWAGGAATSAVFLPGSVGNVGSCDIAGDCNGNFWVLAQNATPYTLRKFSSTGTLLTTYTLTGTFGLGGNGLAINGNSVYFDGFDGELYTGVINNVTNTVAFSKSTTTAPFTANPISDFASCGYESMCLGHGDLDSIGYCGDTARITLRATGPGPYNFTVVSGTATLTSSGNTANVTAWGPALITYMDADCGGANTIMDTTVVFVTKATVFAGNDTTLIGCRGFFYDTLNASYSDTTIGVIYDIDWGPLDGTIISGNKTTRPVISPTGKPNLCKYYTMTMTTLNGCTFKDSLLVCVADSTPKANFTYQLNLGCDEDTVRFINLTPSNPYVSDVLWDFDDTVNNNGNRITSTEVSPVHIYKDPGIYSVLLTMSNQWCLDTFRQYVNILHPLVADFDVKDSACAHEILSFTDKSTTPPPINGRGTTFLYQFGDGDTSILSSPTHIYKNAGSYPVRLSLIDGLGCKDTATKIIFIDTIPYVRFIAPDSVLCQGQAVRLLADYLHIGDTGSVINMGDGSIFLNSDTTIYAYSQPGAYDVVFTAKYRACADTSAKLHIVVNPYPGVNIGPDTVFCPNGTPLVLSDRVNINNPEAKFKWSTGDTTASILAKDIGTYWVRVTVGGCSGTDSAVVNKDCYINIPNAFTPDGDGTNDYFLPRQYLSRSLTAFKMSIYNRWGEIVYESSSINGRGWDGKFNQKDQPVGVYVYLIDVTFDNGVSEHYTGNLTLLR
jgi:gliding motility-associated-like protein